MVNNLNEIEIKLKSNFNEIKIKLKLYFYDIQCPNQDKTFALNCFQDSLFLLDEEVVCHEVRSKQIDFVCLSNEFYFGRSKKGT